MSDDDPDNPIRRARRHLYDAIVESLRIEDDPRHEGHVVSGWVLIAETYGPDGQMSMLTRSSNATGEVDLPPWTSEGWCRYAAASGYFDPVPADDDDA